MIVPEYTMMQGVRINERAQACSDIQREAVQCAGRGREVGWGREEYPEHRVRRQDGTKNVTEETATTHYLLSWKRRLVCVLSSAVM